MAKLNCLGCGSELGENNKSVLELSVMKAVSKIDIDLSNGCCSLKCSRCREWNCITKEKHYIDTQRKGKEVLEYKK